MKKLVVFFSQTGNTKKVAGIIAKKLGADLDEIVDRNAKPGERGPSKGEPDISFRKDPSKYDLVVIGSPVWAFGVPPATREYLGKNEFKKVSFFCTYAIFTGMFFRKMKSLSKEPVAKLKVNMKRIDDSGDRIEGFCRQTSA